MEEYQNKSNPLSIGIKKIGIGKKNSKDLTQEIIDAIFTEIQNSNNPKEHIQISALMGALLIKNPLSNIEKNFLKVLVTYFSQNRIHKKYASSTVFFNNKFYIQKLKRTFFSLLQKRYMKHIPYSDIKILNWLLKGKPLDLLKRKKLSTLFFQQHKEYIKNKRPKQNITLLEKTHEIETYKAFAISNIRYRYTDIKEYQQFYDSLMLSLKKEADFLVQKTSFSSKIINISEPFDGTNKNFLLTPIIANYCISQNYYPIQIVGNSSGPKLEMNLLDIAKSLQGKFIHSANDIMQQASYKLFCNLHHFSIVLNEWQKIRKYTIKRPFLSTLEKFPRIFQADFFISSAFHDNFCSIMLSIAEHAGYKKIIIIHKGREGTIGFSLAKPTIIYLSKKQANGSYKRSSFEFSLNDINQELESDGRLQVSSAKNSEFIEAILKNQDIEGIEFQKWKKRVILTQSGIQKAMEYMSEKDISK